MQTSSVTRFSKKLIVTSLSFFLTIGLMLPGFFATPAQAGARTCLTVISGNGPEGTTDAVVQFLDSSNVYQDAFIIPPHTDNDGQPPDTNYAVIPGTHYVAVSVDGHGPEQADQHFRANFTLPAGFNNPSFSIQVHCDNQATVFLNGNSVGAQMFAEDIVNFQDPAEVFTDNNAAHFVAGVNVLDITAHNFTDRVALDFKADICFDTGCRDQDPPAISCNVGQTSLWPPNHQLETVGLTATVSDDCDGQVTIGGGPGVNGVAVYSDEQDLDQGSGNFSPDAKNIGVGTLRLRSERGGPFNGRVYLIVVQATDASGKTGYCAKTVTVPHDQSKASKQSVEAQAATARNYFLANHVPPPGFVQVGIGPVVGPKQ
jgi:hypothetical protein